MSCPVSISDISLEANKAGPLPEFGNLETDDSIAILSAIVVEANQKSDVLSADGLGEYKLSKENLEVTGLIKPDLPDIPLDDLLSDPSVFTGKLGINQIEDILKKPLLQKIIMQNAIKHNIAEMIKRGIIDALDLDALLIIAASTSLFSLANIKAYLQGKLTSSTLYAAITALIAKAKYAVQLTKTKIKSLGSALSKIGKPAIKGPKLSTNTIDTTTIDTEVDKIIGSSRIASAVKTSTSSGISAKSVF